MSRQARDPARQPAWEPEGSEAALILDLARSGLPLSRIEQAGERRFLHAFDEYTEVLQRKRGWPLGFRTLRLGLGFAGALAVAVVAYQASTWRDNSALSYDINHGGVARDELIQSNLEPVELGFSDGTVVTVEPSTTARVSETTHRGARFRLDSGRMAFNVVPNPERGRWLVDAGPFQVRVTGTVFTVEWIAAEGSLRVEVTRGHVVVEGAGQRRELGPGDSFQHREPSAAPTGSAATSSPANSEQQVTPELPELAPPSSKSGPHATGQIPNWSQMVAAGEFKSVIDAALQRGVKSCLDRCTQADLRALADAARLGGQRALAERALLAQRARFTGSSDASAAAFLLGRSAEERHDGRATSWYDTYLAEAPQGRFASDALGRKMMLVAKSDPKRGVALAEQYLSRFPSGSYASHARSLVELKHHPR